MEKSWRDRKDEMKRDRRLDQETFVYHFVTPCRVFSGGTKDRGLQCRLWPRYSRTPPFSTRRQEFISTKFSGDNRFSQSSDHGCIPALGRDAVRSRSLTAFEMT